LKRLNKILLVFCAFSFLTVYGGWRFIHSRKFSDQASRKVSEILTKKIGAKLAFTGVDFNMFPPATIFKNVHIEKKDPAIIDVDLSVEELSVAFTYSSFFSSNLEIDDLVLKKGTLKIKTPDKNTPDFDWKDFNLNKIFTKYSEIYLESPLHLNIIRLEDIDAQVDKHTLAINTLSVAPHKKDLRIKLNTAKIHIDPDKKNFAPIDLDKSEVLAELTRNIWRVESLRLEKGTDTINVKGELRDSKKFVQLNGEGQFNAQLTNILKYIPSLPKEVYAMTGKVNGNVIGTGNLTDPDVEMAVTATNFKSEWIELADIRALIKKKNNIVFAEKFHARNNKEQYVLARAVPFFDLKKMSLLRSRVSLNMQDAFTNTFLFAIRHSLETFKGYLTGKVDVVWDNTKVYFEIKDRAFLKDFKLMSKSNKSILQNAGFTLSDTVIDLDKDMKLGINAKLEMANTKIQAKGELTGKEINISIKDSKIDMKAFGPVSGLAITGSGPASAEIYGPMDNVKFDFIVDWNNFSIVDLNFGRVKSEFTLSLKELGIDIHYLSGIYNQSIFSAEGTLGFEDKNKGMDLKLEFKNTNFADARKMYNLVFKNLKLPSDPQFNFTADYSIKGGFGLDTLKIDGNIKGTDLKIFNEEAEQINFKFSLANSLLNFKDLKIKKARGEINAGVSVNLTNNYTELEGNLQGMRLSDFNFYRKTKMEYDGDLLIDFDGNGTTDNFSSRFKTKLNNPFIENIPASPSNAIFYLNSDDVVINANLLSGKVKLDSVINFKTKMASVKSQIDSTDLRELLGVIAGHNMSEKNIAGKINAKLVSEFNIDTMAIKKFSLELPQFNLKKGEINVLVDPRHNSVSIDEGVVRNWDLRFTDGPDFFTCKAHNQSGGIVFDQNFSIKTSLLEFFTSAIDKAVGVMKGNVQLVVDKKINITKVEVYGVRNSFKIKNIPGAVTDLEFNINKKGETFEISKLIGKYGEGDLNVKGTFLFDNMYPTVNLDYKIERATVPLFKRSYLLASSWGTITGTDLPYKLNGKVSLLHGEFLDDPSDFSKDNKVNLDVFKKYLPKKNNSDKTGYLALNVSFDTVNQIVMKNNLAEVYAKGKGDLVGDVLSPEINARVDVLPSVSKFKFKGHEFNLREGFVEIHDKGKNRVSDLKFIGISKINDYDVKLDISGTIENTQIGLSSEPALAQEDLVSLLTIGVTSDMSKNLDVGDRNKVTTVGIGTLLVDQLKINEDLNSTLGLNLSVLPEFKEDESTLITGKSAVSDGTTSRLKSATKIKIQKKINKMVDVSVSSTVGGSIEQTQEMNVNINLNKNFSIEGVYEVKPAEEENTNTPNSIGADLKFRGSF
jgi:translocation and assembly module TamB